MHIHLKHTLHISEESVYWYTAKNNNMGCVSQLYVISVAPYGTSNPFIAEFHSE